MRVPNPILSNLYSITNSTSFCFSYEIKTSGTVIYLSWQKLLWSFYSAMQKRTVLISDKREVPCPPREGISVTMLSIVWHHCLELFHHLEYITILTCHSFSENISGWKLEVVLETRQEENQVKCIINRKGNTNKEGNMNNNKNGRWLIIERYYEQRR